VQLKKLQLLGFKTFADKTEIEIDQGLTAIVGPNGSGKSNIVDALLWVLGEQNPRLLRGANAQDVIFAGTDKRKALGMAEVKLTVDNSDHTLPIDFAEVTITRRVYRSGESQYLLNNAPCRLKDIVELFMDTGVGKGAYSFVSQSEIDAVLSARAEDRRELFEEAAGIKKYRVKKKEALRKLESAEVNLNRVRDILHELEGQREPMEKQSFAARRFVGLQERLHEIEVGLLVSELKKADYELYAARTERGDDQASLLKYDAELAHLERLSSEVGERLAQTEGEMDAVRLSQQNALQTVERTESQLTLMTERGLTAQRSQEQLARELTELADRIARLTDSLEIDQADRDEAEAGETARRHEWAAQKASLGELEGAVTQALRDMETRQSERMRLAQERAGREAALKAARDRLADAQTRAERLQSEAVTLNNAIADAQAREQQAQSARDERARQREAKSEARRDVEARQRQAQSELAATRTALENARRTQAEQSARLATLTELQENHEGFYQGVRAVLNAHKRGPLRGHYKAVVDLLTVPEPYRVAIEVALGGSLQDIVTQTESEAKAGIQWLKDNRAGRATFLAVPLLKPGQKISPPASQNSNSKIQNGMDLIDYAPEYEVVAQYLLGRVLVVETMDDAIAASRKMTGWSKIVTLEGELLSPGGALTGGSLQGKGAHLVGRKGEMDDMRARLPHTRTDVERLAAQVEVSTRTLQQLEAERGELQKEESRLQAEIASQESARAAAEREQKRLTGDKTGRDSAQANLAAQIVTLQADTHRLTQLLEAGRAENVTSDDALAALNDETRALIARRDECRRRAIALEVEVSRLREKREGLTRALASDRATLAGLQNQQQQKHAQRTAAQTQGTDAVAERARLTQQLADAREHLKIVEAEWAQWRDQRQKLLNANFETNGAIKDVTQKRSAVTKNLHDTELRLARLEVQLSQAVERLQDEYSIMREDALCRPDDTAIDRNTAMEVGRLRRELRGMGQVNTGAIAEYERLTERFDFLTTQRADLDKGREGLLATIAEIDDSTRGVFMETFEAVRSEFDRLFTQLFEGGSTKLVLTNPDDILETGIEVIAQPPGKKAQHLSLLSGGERALTATALLFAFLSVKPSPFVLLDEVDAPLDGANVEKYTHLVRDFAQRSQFLLITHNPTTMEAAPTWYGVTMREAGVSSILSYRVPQESTLTETAEAVVLSR
jgi:chromosome segregation protein